MEIDLANSVKFKNIAEASTITIGSTMEKLALLKDGEVMMLSMVVVLVMAPVSSGEMTMVPNAMKLSDVRFQYGTTEGGCEGKKEK